MQRVAQKISPLKCSGNQPNIDSETTSAGVVAVAVSVLYLIKFGGKVFVFVVAIKIDTNLSSNFMYFI